MTRNIKVVLFVSVLFGSAVGLYDFALPYYLESRGVSFAQMGYIFAISATVMFVLRVYLGNLSDRLGRKLFYSLALGLSAVINFVTPLGTTLVPLAAFKSAREGALFTREVMHPVVIYEEAPRRFLGFIALTRGMEYFFQGVGTIVAGVLLVSGFGGVFVTAGAALMLAFVVFTVFFREGSVRPPATRAITWRDLFDFRLPHNLAVVAVSSFIFTLGLSMSHCFIMPLFFTDKFHVPQATVATVLMLHRFTLGAPMVLAALIPRRLFKPAYTWSVVAEGAALAASAFIPHFLPAAIVWLLHDLVGASFWVPVQNTIIQESSRHGVRGSDVSKTLALGALGGIAGPFITGYLAQYNVSAPIFASGIAMALSAIPLARLRLDVHPAPEDSRNPSAA